MERDVCPAIVRDVCEKDEPVRVPTVNGRPDVTKSDKILSQPSDTVSHSRGMGDSGYRVQVVKHDCPADHCSFDRMVRRIDVTPVRHNEIRYWCLNPNCVHYANDVVSYACKGSYPHRTREAPTVVDWNDA